MLHLQVLNHSLEERRSKKKSLTYSKEKEITASVSSVQQISCFHQKRKYTCWLITTPLFLTILTRNQSMVGWHSRPKIPLNSFSSLPPSMTCLPSLPTPFRIHVDSCQDTHSSLISPVLRTIPNRWCPGTPPQFQIQNSSIPATSPYPAPTMQDVLLPPSSHYSKNPQTRTPNHLFSRILGLFNHEFQINFPRPSQRRVRSNYILWPLIPERCRQSSNWNRHLHAWNQEEPPQEVARIWRMPHTNVDGHTTLCSKQTVQLSLEFEEYSRFLPSTAANICFQPRIPCIEPSETLPGSYHIVRVCLRWFNQTTLHSLMTGN